MVFRGNGSSDLVGTVLAPTACIDFRGNSEGYQTRSQIIGYTVSSNGTGEASLIFNADENYKILFPARTGLAK